MSATDTADQALQTGTWQVETAHSSASFSVRHLGLSKVRGHFETVEGVLEVAEDPTRSSIRVDIDAASINTNQADRDAHLKSADFLDVENHPKLTFQSTSIAKDSDDEWTVEGELTIRGVTKPVTLDVEFLGVAPDPFGQGRRIAFEASTQIARHDFGLSWEGPQQAGGALVGRKVDIDIDVQFLQAR